MRRRRDRRLAVATDLTITSMVDMFTLILTFLLNFVNPSDQASAAIALPLSRSTEGVATGVTLSISPAEVRVDGVTVVTLDRSTGTPHLPNAASLEAVTEGLATARSAHPPSTTAPGQADEPPTLIVESDRGIPFSLVGTVLDGARQAGFTRFRFVVSGGG